METTPHKMSVLGETVMKIQEDVSKSALVKCRLEDLINGELKELNGTIRNEHIWELGHEGDDPNPHTDNIEKLVAYRDVLYKIADEYGLECAAKK